MDADVVETRYYIKGDHTDEFVPPHEIGNDIMASEFYPDIQLDKITQRFVHIFNVVIAHPNETSATYVDSMYDDYGRYFEIRDANTSEQPQATWGAGHRFGSKKVWKRLKQGQLRNVGTVDELFPCSEEPHLTCQACKDAQIVGGFGTGRYAVRCEEHREEEYEWRHHDITPGTRRRLKCLKTQDTFWTE